MTSQIERFIRIEVPAGALWRTLPNGTHVRVWEMGSVDERADEARIRRFIFHIGYLDGVARGCRLSYLGTSFTVLNVSDSTRLRGLELRCAPLS